MQRTKLSLTPSHTIFRTVSRKCIFRFHIDVRSLRTQRLRANAISNKDEKREMHQIKRLLTVNTNVPLLIEDVRVHRNCDVRPDYCYAGNSFSISFLIWLLHVSFPSVHHQGAHDGTLPKLVSLKSLVKIHR